MPEDNQSPLSMQEAVRAMTHTSGQREPSEDNPGPDEEDQGQDPSEEPSEDDLAEGLTEEDEDNPQEEDDDGTPEEPEEEQPDEEYAAGRFAADNAKTRLADGRVTTIAELKQGNLLQSDYSRKTVALAEERKLVEQTKAQFQAVEHALAQERETVALIVQAYLPRPPDPAMLNPNSGNFDVVGYMAEKEAYERNTQQIQQMISQHQQMQQRQATEAEQARRQARDQEAERLFEAMPEIAKPEAYQRFWSEAVQYAAKRGYSAEELDEVDDHRTYTILRDAMAYDRLKSRVKDAKSKVNGKPPMLQGSTRRSPDVVRHQDANSALARLNKSGSLKDGVAALLAREKVR